ncbi:MAG: 30S ribosomal protein S12 methylthiotransferase RimO [Lachnospiraceae bacterium]|nr:30S ribosomal protein S12 methylthiotransferase RimO [Lachnospiraceae bacterium]
MASVYILSLGCDKNLVDSEVMLGLLNGAGHSFTDDPSKAEVILVNTCAFIGDAKKESIQAILELARQKEEGCCRVLIASGCLAERYKEEILAELPELDAVVGTASYDRIAETVEKLLAGSEKAVRVFDDQSRIPAAQARILTTGGHYAYLKIAEGCDKFCAYCAIPFVRGRYRSFPMERLIREAETLVSGGVRELILVAQETTLYGTDLYGRKALPDLIRGLAAIPDLRWIRLLYGYPEELTDEMIDLMASEPKLCHYLDLPIQHAADSVLARMGRTTTKAQLRSLIGKLRERIPDIALRTTLMSGFPGETEEEHQENLDFIREIRFDRLGAFAYSREEGTAADRMKNQVPVRIRKKRRNELMRAQQEVAFAKAASMPGRILEVMIEGQVAEEDTYVARTYMDAPEVDGYLFLSSSEPLVSGDFVTVRVTGARNYDLMGERTDESAE